ncbi:hypothetical protein GGH96_003644 [Coemansia sp. RSA 1972]|nr:hypothetical protein GGH96_003644 [Coemansia sp. RSA 1972]
MHLPSALVAASALIASCAGHSMLAKPASRGNVEWWGTCAAGAGCKGPCDSPKASSPFNSIYNPKTYVQRGQELDVQWNRLNHPGGFVRMAMVPFDQSDDWASFNDNILKYTCYETNCGPANSSDTVFGHLNGPGSSPCTSTVTIPKNIPDNTAVTLQWIWYGGGIYYGQVDTSFGEYYGCSDMIVVGGPTSNEKPAPVFQGGDITYPNSGVCKYWGSNKVGDCNFGDRKPSPVDGDLLSQSLEPCMRGPEQKGTPFGMDSGSSSPDTSSEPASDSAAPGSSVAESPAAPVTPVTPETSVTPVAPATSEVPVTSDYSVVPEQTEVVDTSVVPEVTSVPEATSAPVTPASSEYVVASESKCLARPSPI